MATLVISWLPCPDLEPGRGDDAFGRGDESVAITWTAPPAGQTHDRIDRLPGKGR
jgi:hypothetical protein